MVFGRNVRDTDWSNVPLLGSQIEERERHTPVDLDGMRRSALPVSSETVTLCGGVPMPMLMEYLVNVSDV